MPSQSLWFIGCGKLLGAFLLGKLVQYLMRTRKITHNEETSGSISLQKLLGFGDEEHSVFSNKNLPFTLVEQGTKGNKQQQPAMFLESLKQPTIQKTFFNVVSVLQAFCLYYPLQQMPTLPFHSLPLIFFEYSVCLAYPIILLSHFSRLLLLLRLVLWGILTSTPMSAANSKLQLIPIVIILTVFVITT